VLLGSLTVLFTATLVAYVVTRLGNPIWRAPTLPRLPLGLLASSSLIIGTSVALHRALGAVRHNQLDALTRWLDVTIGLALGFLTVQAANWFFLSRAAPSHGGNVLYAFTFFLLTGLHAAHVVGGLVPLFVVAARARQREYSSSRFEGVLLCTQYWHFLTVVWFALLLAIYIGSG
jgi:cytochrome c oxidase subunit 3